VGRTVLMISHRLSTLGNVDEIIVLKDGTIAEQGSYKELKRKNGVFAGLLKEQNRYNVDYAGESMIVPKVELARILNEQRQGAVAPESYPMARPAPVPPPLVLADLERDRHVAAKSNGAPRQPLKARVIVEVEGKLVGERRLDKPVLTVGRQASNDVPVPSQRVSRLHAKIRWDKENGAWLIEDADSLNGLTYQGRRIDQHVLNRGDRVYIAPAVVLLYETL
ncbi:MAG TPA: FHA domain-containing protein, partial [Ktedonobacteraceae bacterium]|nr:FHA domain-containing protein [Ktedonobacteraceae bacterium]